jgi:hypothetical protein
MTSMAPILCTMTSESPLHRRVKSAFPRNPDAGGEDHLYVRHILQLLCRGYVSQYTFAGQSA